MLNKLPVSRFDDPYDQCNYCHADKRKEFSEKLSKIEEFYMDAAIRRADRMQKLASRNIPRND